MCLKADALANDPRLESSIPGVGDEVALQLRITMGAPGKQHILCARRFHLLIICCLVVLY